MIRFVRRAMAATVLLSAVASAQPAREPIPVRTFTLKRLAVKDAAKLLSPYLQSASSGAFETGSDVQAITIRGTPRELKTVDSLLAIFDRTPRSVLLRFQIIEAVEDSRKDPRIAEVEASLHELFRYPGYRLIGEGIAKSEEEHEFSLSLGGEGASYAVEGTVMSSDDASGMIRLAMSMSQPIMITLFGNQPLFSTRLSVPVGQIVVLGSASPRFYDRKAGDTSTVAMPGASPRIGRPIILTVRPEFIGKR